MAEAPSLPVGKNCGNQGVALGPVTQPPLELMGKANSPGICDSGILAWELEPLV